MADPLFEENEAQGPSEKASSEKKTLAPKASAKAKGRQTPRVKAEQPKDSRTGKPVPRAKARKGDGVVYHKQPLDN